MGFEFSRWLSARAFFSIEFRMFYRWQTIDKTSERAALPCGSTVTVQKEGSYLFRWILEFADGTTTTGKGTSLTAAKKRWLTFYRIWVYGKWGRGVMTPEGFLVPVKESGHA